MTKSILLQRLNHKSSLTPPTTSLARRALLLVSFLLIGLGNVWGQTLTKGTPSVTIEKDLVITNNEFVITGADFQSFLGNYPCYVRFSAYDNDENPLNIISVTSDYGKWRSFVYDYAYGAWSGILWNSSGDGGEITVSLNEGTVKLECYAYTSGLYFPEDGDFGEPDGGTLITYEVPATDEFYGDYSRSEPTPMLHEVTDVETEVEPVTFIPTITNARYARFYLEQDGSVQSSSYDNLTLKSGNEQKDQDWKKRGIYVYNSDGLTEDDLTVNVKLDKGTFPQYQLVAYFSDEAPALEGTTITKEPENLKEKQIYSFTYPVKTVEKYFEWNKTSQEIDLRSYLQNDLPVLLENNLEKGYIAWSIYDGPYGVGVPITILGTYNSSSEYWQMSLNEYATKSLFYLDDPTHYTWNNNIQYYLKPTVYIPNNKEFSDYPDYVVVCEVSDESKTNIKVRYIFHFNEDGKVPFPGKLVGEKDGETLTVNRSDNNAPIELGNAISHKKLTDGVKYARFYLTDYKGNLIDPTDRLTVSGGNVSACTKTEFGGFYIYNYGSSLNLSDVSVTLNTPKEYKLYKVVGVFATDMETAIFEDGTMAREPDWDLQYTYSFGYNITTENLGDRVAWRRNGMTPNVSTDDPEKDWNTSWNELGVEQYVKWYIVKDNEALFLKEYTGSRGDTWTIDADGYKVTDDGIAVLTRQSIFTSALWKTWARPTIYPPVGVEYEDGYQIICEIYTNSAGNGNPNAKYTFVLYKSFLGELKDKGTEGRTTVAVGGEDMEADLKLSDVMVAYDEAVPNHAPIKYARVWLTKTDGTMLDPTDTEKLTVSGTLYGTDTEERTDKTFGYYFTIADENSLDLSTIIANLNLSKVGAFDRYQVHVAFSTDALILPVGSTTYEPDYDYEYTFSFQYPWKTKYKTLIYNSTTNSCMPQLLQNWRELAIDCNVDRSTLAENLYVRWYLIDEKDDVITNNFTIVNGGYTQAGSNNTYYRYKFDKTNFTSGQDGSCEVTVYNPTITFPTSYKDTEYYKNVRLVCVATTKTENYPVGSWDGDPEIQVKYIYTLMTTSDLEALPFIHYQGEAYRYMMEELGDVSGAKLRDYKTVKGNAPEENYTWNTSTNNYEPISGNIRQGVHTWEYDLYIQPDDIRELALPFQYYNQNNSQNQEPRAYIRWYDWNTDMKVESDGTFEFTGTGTTLKDDSRGRGLFSLCHPENLSHIHIGVTFKPNASFSNTIDIACDVSKYADGMDESCQYLIHEPTLSNRYIFHIHPATEISDRLDKAKTALKDAEDIAKSNPSKKQDLYNAMSDLEEDKGKVVVSLGSDYVGEFSLRFDMQDISNYVLKNSNIWASNSVQWYAYYEQNGNIVKKKVNGDPDVTRRIYTFQYKNKFDAPKCHVVGFIGNGDFNVETEEGTYAPVVHYELHFIEASPKPLNELPNERTDAYMKYHYDVAGIVDFDGNPKTNPNVAGHEAEYYSTPNWDDAPTSAADNITYVPFPWNDIQYGFCHPELTSTIKNGYYTGVAPEHGDYIVVKSINMDGVSKGIGDQGDFIGDNTTTPYNYRWWNEAILYDYTHEVIDDSKYGSFIYTDASDESRSIATIPFEAELCDGSSIYFTAIVADMTIGTAHPQLLIRIVGIKDDGTRVRIVAFHTGDIKKIVDANGSSFSAGQWYQVYGASTVPTNFKTNTDITHFEAEVINYANNTDGADFAFDQLVIYTSTAKVLLTQTGSNSCDDATANEENEVLIYMSAEGLQNAFNTNKDELQPVYWRICEEELDENGKVKVVTGAKMYPQYNENGLLDYDKTDPEDLKGENTYGISWVKPNYSESDITSAPNPFGWYRAEDNNIYFQLSYQSFPKLEKGKNYYVSVYQPCTEEEFIEHYDESLWGDIKYRCTIYSEFFIPRQQYVTYIIDVESGEEGGDYVIECGGTEVQLPAVKMVIKVPNKNNKITGFETFDDWRFDYAFFSVSLWNTNTKLGDDTEYTYEDLYTAWRHYRGANSDYAKDGYTDPGLDNRYQYTNEQNLDCRAVLEYAIGKGLLVLANSNNYKPTFNKAGTYTILCLPIKQEITLVNETTPTQICAPFEVTFTVKGGGNLSLVLGFDGVSYPPNYTRVVRVGLEQLNNAKVDSKKGFTVHIPVQSFESTSGSLVFDSPNLTLYRATDGKTASTTTNVAILQGDTNADRATVNSTHKYLAVKFNQNFDFYEGFEYELHTVYYDKDDDNGSGQHKENACLGDLYFIIKVVPEFVTWKGGNSEWNNDGNWSRSTRAELYKSEDGTQNTETEAQGNGTKKGIYQDNAQINNNLTSNPAFVPMKFTYVTVPSAENAPNLSRLEIDGTEGIYTQNTLNDDIRYDLMVRYTEEYCVTDGHEGYNDQEKNIYDCEKFYGNWAKEIYFKPNAELVHQHYLTYGKVWVEKLLTANTWTLMSTPLQNTYAGDMYVPAVAIPDYSSSEENATVIGQQVTEAFQPIKFVDTKNNGFYSRTLYPIYQRSWAQTGSTVYTKTNDVRANSYSANIITSTVGETLAQWSHTYNDVTVGYGKGFGFAIRAHKKDQSNDALLRLPKEDENYNYYQWDGTSQEPAAGNDVKTVSKTTTGKLFTDGEDAPDSDNLTYGVDYGGTTPSTDRTAGDGTINVNIDDVQKANGYLLVGNPYLCSIDMGKFLSDNNNRSVLDESAYWTYEYNKIDPKLPGTGNYIKPLQSFFVKLNSGVTSGNIVFNEDMMIDRSSSQPQSAPALTMTASNERGQSSARVMVGDEAKRVETLLDSNLDDVPMVYTVADGQAVGINQLTTLDKPIAFGVTCMASDELVEVTFTDVAQLTTGEVTVVDAVTGEQTAISEGSVVSIQPNDYGRYYLLAGATGIGDKMDVQKGVMVRVRGNEVTVNSGEELTQVRALTLNGALTYQHTAGGNEASFMLSSGVYIIQAENVAGEQQTVKVVIR